MPCWCMEKETVFHGRSVAIDLARVRAFERPVSLGIAEVLGRRRNLRVTLTDGSSILVEGDDDTDGFMAAMEGYLESA